MIHVSNLNFAYNDSPILNDLNFKISDGEFLGIIGPNGAGKSTLLKLLNRILIPLSGQINIQGKPLHTYSRKALARIIGFVPQDFTSAFDFSVKEIILMGRFPHQRMFGFETSKDLEIVRSVMKATDCHYLKERNFLTLSGGERQRVILASALAQEPQILLLDEPTNALDLKHQVHFYGILKNLQKNEGMTILSVTHDVNLAAQFCERILVLKSGSILADGIVSEVLKKDLLQSVYDTPVEIVLHPVSGLPVILPELK